MLTTADRPKNWFPEHPVLGKKSFVFWVIIHRIADRAFKGISSVDELFSKWPPPGREFFTLQWTDHAKGLPFFHMVTSEGPKESKGLDFSSLHHNFTSLAECKCFKDHLCVHRAQGGVANEVDCKSACIILRYHVADGFV